MSNLRGKHQLSEKGKFVGYWRFDRLGERSPLFKDLYGFYDTAIVGAEAFKLGAKKLKDDGRLTEKGVREKLVERAVSDLSELKTMALKATRPLRRDVETRLRAMKPAEIDRKDIAGEMQRREVRDRLNAMAPAQREKFVMGTDDGMVMDAILSAPRLLVDLPNSMVEELTRKRLNERFGDEMIVLNALGEAADTVDRAFDAARDEIRLTLGMNPSEFENFAKGVEAPIVDAWAKGFERTAPDTSGPVFKAAADKDLATALLEIDWRDAPVVSLDAAKRKADVDRRPASMEGTAA